MKTASLLILTALMAHADFSYVTVRKSNTPSPATATPGNDVTHHYLKGQKMMVDSGSFASIIDFESQTVTTLNKTQNTYTVHPFDAAAQAIPSDVDASIDVQDTGQHRTINGFNATQVMMKMSIESQRPGAAGMKMQVEIENWISSDIPGAEELRAFFKRNAARFPWSAMAGQGNPAMQQSMANAMRKLASLGGVPVLQIIRPKMAGAPGANAAQSAQMQQGMAQARARLEAMAQAGGPGAAIAQQQLARINAMSGGAAGGGGGGFETTMESSGFSTAPISEATFAIPAGYQKSGQ